MNDCDFFISSLLIFCRFRCFVLLTFVVAVAVLFCFHLFRMPPSFLLKAGFGVLSKN